MILLSSPLKKPRQVLFFLEIEIFTTKIVNSKSLKKICRQLLSAMNVLKKILKMGVVINLRWCPSHKVFIMLDCYNFHKKDVVNNGYFLFAEEVILWPQYAEDFVYSFQFSL